VTAGRRPQDGAFRLVRTLRRLRERVPLDDEAGDETLEALFHRWSRLRSPDLDLTVREHDPRWAEAFEIEARRIRAALGDEVADIQHVGSTSIPPLPAKNIVDLSVATRTPSVSERQLVGLTTLGYEIYGPSPIHPELTWLWRIDADQRGALVVHVGHHRNPYFAYIVNFRDFMRALPDERQRYEQLKRELAAVPGQSWLEYSVCKGVLAWRITQRANAWATARDLVAR
jgi:GrpB-like predicted nucleotidyltransferase (UPF0157 family)